MAKKEKIFLRERMGVGKLATSRGMICQEKSGMDSATEKPIRKRRRK